MSWIDWLVLIGSIVSIIGYGLYRSRKSQCLDTYLGSKKEMSWLTVGVSVMATQASAITFLSTPGQAFADGMGFIQFYFGLPLAVLLLSFTLLPLYHKLNVRTAYEYLESRFDLKTRSLAAFLFLIQRGLAAGLTIYAPALVLSGILGWNIHFVITAIGLVVVLYTVSGGTKAVSHIQKPSMMIMLAGIAFAGLMLVFLLPREVAVSDALYVAKSLGKLEATDWSFDLNSRYNVWSGLFGGVFLFMSYFGTDQSQVQRYLGGKTIKEARWGLYFNGIFKIPLQLGILLIGVFIFVFFQFEKRPLLFSSQEVEMMHKSPQSEAFKTLEKQHAQIFQQKKEKLLDLLKAKEQQEEQQNTSLKEEIFSLNEQEQALRLAAKELLSKEQAKIAANEQDQVFLHFVLRYFPPGLIGLLIAVVLFASMSSSASELNALATTSLVDVYKRTFRKHESQQHYLLMSKSFTLFWGLYAILFAQFAGLLGNLIQAVNILGSLFYGTLLGLFLSGFYLKKTGAKETFLAALLAQFMVVFCFFFTSISFLWYNVIGCMAVVGGSLLLRLVFKLFKTRQIEVVSREFF